MSERPPDHFLNFDAANELEEQLQRARQLIQWLAARLAASDPRRCSGLEDLVEREHVRRAGEILFRKATTSDFASPPGSHADVSRRDVFVSFSHEDEAFASELSQVLDKAAVSHFKADRDLHPASDWAEVIWEAIRECKVFLVVLTPRFLESDWYKMEGGAACALGKPVLVVLRYVDPQHVLEPFKRFQSMVVETSGQLERLARELHRLCQG